MADLRPVGIVCIDAEVLQHAAFAHYILASKREQKPCRILVERIFRLLVRSIPEIQKRGRFSGKQAVGIELHRHVRLSVEMQAGQRVRFGGARAFIASPAAPLPKHQNHNH